ncbi:MAG: RAD55 family ATPase, partial [Candidatus Syntropharchaeia archaeon]
SFLKGMQRESKKWDGLIYGLLTANIFGNGIEEEIADCADGVLVFEWDEKSGTRRQRTMYIKKFRGLLPLIEGDKISRFETKITVDHGFEVSNVKLIAGGKRKKNTT